MATTPHRILLNECMSNNILMLYTNQELVIEDQGRDCAEALVRMKNLESLTLENYSWHHNDER